MVALAPNVTTNPVEWQEFRSQKHRIPAFIRRWWVSIPAMLTVIFIAIALTLSDIDSPTREMAINAIWIFHIVVVMRALIAGSMAISREHGGRTWEPLVLTGISIRQILFGKWLGVMHQIAPWMLGLGTLRLMMLPVLMLAFLNRYAWRTSAQLSSYYQSYGYNDGYTREVSWVVWAALLAVALTVILTLLEVMSSSAIGLAAGAVMRRPWLALIAAVCIRFIPVFVFALVTRQQVGIAPSWRILRATPLALADSGSASLYQLVLPHTHWTTTAHANALPGVMLAGGLLTLLLVISLLVTWFAIRASGALPEKQA